MQSASTTYLSSADMSAGRVLSFGDVAAEYSAFRRGAALVPLLGSAALRVTGADRSDFVHGQVSNEVKRLGVGEVRDALMLNHRGHALAQLRIFRRRDDLLLVTEGGAGGFVNEQLGDHIIFDQVELEPLVVTTLSLQGVAAETILKDVFGIDTPEDKRFLEAQLNGTALVVSPSRRSLQGGYDLSVQEDAVSDVLGALIGAGAVLAGETSLNVARVVAGIPTAESEGGEGILPQEAGLEPLVSYTKGCYLGQEIMARIEARGKVRRSLQGLKLSDVPELDERDLSAEGKRVGRLGTVVNHPDLGVIALAVLRNDLEDAVITVGGVKAELRLLPFSGEPQS